MSRFSESISTFTLLKSLPANCERRLIQLFLDLLSDGERCGLRVGCGRCRHINTELVTSGFAETQDRLASEDQRCGISGHRTTNKLAPEHASEPTAPLFKAGAKRRSIVRWSTGRFEPGGVSRNAISSAEQPTDASSSTLSSSIGIFGLAIKRLRCQHSMNGPPERCCEQDDQDDNEVFIRDRIRRTSDTLAISSQTY